MFQYYENVMFSTHYGTGTIILPDIYIECHVNSILCCLLNEVRKWQSSIYGPHLNICFYPFQQMNMENTELIYVNENHWNPKWMVSLTIKGLKKYM